MKTPQSSWAQRVRSPTYLAWCTKGALVLGGLHLVIGLWIEYKAIRSDVDYKMLFMLTDYPLVQLEEWGRSQVFRRKP